MIRILATVFAGLLGLAFGSFLNVCLSRWPEDESVVTPRSHCRSCGRTLAWWENLPLVSWLALRGRCRTCKSRISWRYPLIELAVGGLWALVTWQSLGPPFENFVLLSDPTISAAVLSAKCIFLWLLVALAVLDAEHLWLPNWLTIPGIALGLVNFVLQMYVAEHLFIMSRSLQDAAALFALGILAAASLILLIRWLYWLVRRREGMGLGDAKLMALLAAWLGLPGALLSFALGVFLGAIFAVGLVAMPNRSDKPEPWILTKLPFGTFLCIGGIVSALWGQPIIASYLRWAGF